MQLLVKNGTINDFETVVASPRRRVHVSMSASLLKDKDGKLIGTLGISKDITRRVELERRLLELSITDELTGLYNHRHFQERAATEIQRARRQRTRLSLVLMDLDGFKAVNDELGHLQGDRILRAAAEAIRRSVRAGVDSGFRYGGDEFVVLLPGLGERTAASVARRIQGGFEDDRSAGRVTLSFGVASLRAEDGVRDFLRRADERMYRAKRQKKSR